MAVESSADGTVIARLRGPLCNAHAALPAL